jgi:riboflavin biosynthesis pyrimidine reductase
MKQIFPEEIEVDPITVYNNDIRTPINSRPWMLLNMVNSVDGFISFEGKAGGLSGPMDKNIYQIIRGLADIILVGAGTVRAENYNAPKTPEGSLAEFRKSRGQEKRPRIAVLSSELNLNPDMGLFAKRHLEDKPPLIYTKSESFKKNGSQFISSSEIIDFPEEELHVSRVVENLFDQNAKIVVCEGGPNLNAHLLAAGVIDEFCLSLSPRVVGGEDPALLLNQPVNSPIELSLDRILLEDEFLFCRYLTIR